jgi:hypothetical protein
MLEMVEARRNAGKVEQRYDLFSGLLDVAQEEPDDEAAITEEEIIGKYDTYQFYIVGKRTNYYSRKRVHISPRWT